MAKYSKGKPAYSTSILGGPFLILSLYSSNDPLERLKFYPPCRPSLTIWPHNLCSLAWITRGLPIHSDIEWIGTLTIGVHVCHDLPYLFRRQKLTSCLIDSHKINTVPTCSSPERLSLRPTSCNPDRDSRRLNWLGQHTYIINLVMPALKAESFTAP